MRTLIIDSILRLVPSFLMVGNIDRDLIVVDRIKNGDSSSFEELVEKYQHQVVSLIARQVGDQIVAEELAQDVFVRAYKGIKSFRGESNFSTWLIRISLNVVNSYFSSKLYKQRKRTLEFSLSKHDIQEELADEVTDESKELLRVALENLKPQFKDVLVLCSLEGKKYEDVASILDVPIGTVRSRLNKARLLLKEHLFKEMK